MNSENEICKLVSLLKNDIQEAITTGHISITNSFMLIFHGIKIVEKYKNLSGKQKSELLMSVIEDIAKGADGIAGTEDDLISQEVIKEINVLVSSGLLSSSISVIYSAFKGKLKQSVCSTLHDKNKSWIRCFCHTSTKTNL